MAVAPSASALDIPPNATAALPSAPAPIPIATAPRPLDIVLYATP